MTDTDLIQAGNLMASSALRYIAALIDGADEALPEQTELLDSIGMWEKAANDE